jgi:hypothetical protein
MPAFRVHHTGLSLVLVAAVAYAGLLLSAPADAGDELSLRLMAGQVLGLRAGEADLPAKGLGGFYVQPYRLATGPNLLESKLHELSEPLPARFALDRQTTWRGEPTLTIKLPEQEMADSGELELTVEQVEPHHTYLLHFAHRGQRLDGEFPPIIHVRQYDAAGNWAVPQQNIELLSGTYDWREEVIALAAVENARRLAIMLHHPRGLGQLWIGDLTLHEVTPEPANFVTGHWVRTEDGTARFSGWLPGAPVMLRADARERGDAISVTARLSAPTEVLRASPQALILSFRLPLKADGWRWGDYVRRERIIEPGEDYTCYHLLGRRQFREVSWFPMAAVAGPQHGVALTVPLTPPLFTRLRYDGEGYLCAEFDLGLAARGEGETEEVSFSFDILRFEPRWGWRAALARYYERYPELFASTAKHGGWWIGPSHQVEDLQEFGLQYAEDHFAHPEPTKANNEMGIYTCSYSEPWMWRILASEEVKLSLAQPLSHYLPAVERDADLPASVMDGHDYWTAPRRDSVRAFLNSAIFGPDGQYQVNAVRTYAATFIEMSTSCLPAIRSDRWGDMNRGLLSYQYETLADVARCAATGARMEGVYFDSVGNWSDIAHENHRAEHFRFAAFPLTFSPATATPVISGLSEMAEYMKFIRDKGFVTMANSSAQYCAYAAPYLDMIGAGENFAADAAADQELCHDRSAAFRKSVSFGNSGLLRASPEEAEARFRLLLFYNVYPGIFFSDAAALERARPLYRRYIPLMRAMSSAAWHPVTCAMLDDPDLWLERYGPQADGPVYFAIRNPTAEARTATLAVEPAGFGRQAVVGVVAADAIRQRQMSAQASADKLLATVEVPPEDTVVVELSWPE